MRSQMSNAIHKTSTQAHRQMRGTPGSLKSLVNEAACFRQCLGEKLLQNNLFGFYVSEDGKQLLYH